VLAQRARELGVRHLLGHYIPTSKNAQVASFYPERGFVAGGDGVFSLDLAEHRLDPPSQIAIKVRPSASVVHP
jgi:predicted enzyme involved in methoxymalonyl-ACP biosynthesis